MYFAAGIYAVVQYYLLVQFGICLSFMYTVIYYHTAEKIKITNCTKGKIRSDNIKILSSSQRYFSQPL